MPKTGKPAMKDWLEFTISVEHDFPSTHPPPPPLSGSHQKLSTIYRQEMTSSTQLWICRNKSIAVKWLCPRRKRAMGLMLHLCVQRAVSLWMGCLRWKSKFPYPKGFMETPMWNILHCVLRVVGTNNHVDQKYVKGCYPTTAGQLF